MKKPTPRKPPRSRLALPALTNSERAKVRDRLHRALSVFIAAEKDANQFLPVTPEGVTTLSAAITLDAILKVV